MKKRFIFGMSALLAVLSLSACNNGKGDSAEPSKKDSSTTVTTSEKEEIKKGIEISNITLSSQDNKAYITVTGKQSNYTAEDFKWAWGLMEQDTNTFVDGKETPAAEDYKTATFNASNSFTLKYCLTDIQTLKSGTLYRIYGGTPETYDDIEFKSNNFGAQDATRKYYLRSDQNNSLVYDSIQPISFTQASVIKITQDNLPEGITNAGAYLKISGRNKDNLTVADIKTWEDAGKIAGNFQLVIGGEYELHAHTASERFYTIEDMFVNFYFYVGFIKPGEGWMTHFDLVEGNAGSNFQLGTTINGQGYTVGNSYYTIHADSSKGGEENYWGCLGIKSELVS